MSTFYPGQRLSTKGDRCTVQYVGEVKGKKGQWLGVEWDDPTRGKHSGTFDHHIYFKCKSRHPTAGSFIRPTITWDQSRSFLDAMRFKYVAPEISGPVNHETDLVRISGKIAEEVGFDKIARQQAQLENLRVVVLDDLQLKHHSDPISHTEISQTCPSITTLDIGRNLFETLPEVASICAQLGQLRSLTLNGNRLRTIKSHNQDAFDPSTLEALGQVRLLELDNMLLQPQDLDDLLGYFSRLRTLSAASNQFVSLEGCHLPPSLESINLDNNDFTSLADVRCLDKSCQQLNFLSLKNNHISSAGVEDGQAFAFPASLSEIDLSYNDIRSWDTIDNLATLCPGLKHLRVSHNPLFEILVAPDGKPLSSTDGYMLTIARLPNLETLNYSSIIDKERLNAETYYLSQIAMQLSLTPAQAEEKVLAEHPRWRELCEEYGEPVIKRREENVLDPNSLAARLIKCTVVSSAEDLPEAFSGETSFTLELPKSMSIYTVMGIIGKRLNLLPMRLRLTWETGERERVKAPRSSRRGVEEWDSSDDEMDDLGGEWQTREVELEAGTRPLGTWIEGDEAVIRVRHRPAPL